MPKPKDIHDDKFADGSNAGTQHCQSKTLPSTCTWYNAIPKPVLHCASSEFIDSHSIACLHGMHGTSCKQVEPHASFVVPAVLYAYQVLAGRLHTIKQLEVDESKGC